MVYFQATAIRGGFDILRIVILFICLLFLQSCGKDDIYSKLTEKEANEMLVVLHRHNINADRNADGDGTYSILVSPEDFSNSVEILSRYGYPSRSAKSMDEVFADSGLVPSPNEERAKMAYALGQELETTIRQISGVTAARVHVALSRRDIYTGSVAPASASVIIHHLPGADVTRQTARVRKLVSGSVEGLAAANVSVSYFMTQDLTTITAFNAAKTGSPVDGHPPRSSAMMSEKWNINGANLLFLGLAAVICVLSVFSLYFALRSRETQVKTKSSSTDS